MLPSGLQAYHWQIIVYLAWFSCLTHLAALTVMRQELYKGRLMRSLRLIAMGLLVVMLVVALVVTTNFY